MKSTFLLLLFCLTFGFSQTAPTNVILSVKQISGNADKTSLIKIDVNGGNNATYTIVVNYIGYFEYTFPTPLTSTTNPVTIWAEDEGGKLSQVLTIKPKTDSELLAEITNGKITLPIKKLPPVIQEPQLAPTIINPKISDIQPANTTFKYKTTVVNTNFTIPVARFNTISDSDTNSKIGDIILFNSIGAGVGVSWGEMEKTVDKNNETINTEFSSSCGMHFGVLFSAGSGEESKNVFAPTFSLSVLDFQVGYGYELGTIETGQKRDFWTIAYAIPLSKLLKGKHLVIASSNGYNSTNPLQEEDENIDSDEDGIKDIDENKTLNKKSWFSKIKSRIWGFY